MSFRFGDQKVILVKGHFHGDLPLCSRDEPVFVAWCTPLAMPENREIVVQGFIQQRIQLKTLNHSSENQNSVSSFC